MTKIRLTQYTIDAIKKSFVENFLPNDELWIFGSRVYPEKKGGDIDLYIESNIDDANVAVKKKLSFLVSIFKQIEEQKIDVVLNLKSLNHTLMIYDVAKKEGVRLV